MDRSLQGRPILVIALTTGLFLVVSFLLHKQMVLLAYPNVTYASVDQYFWHKIVTAISFSVLGFSLGINYWVCSKKYKNQGVVRSLIVPVVVATLLSVLGVLYYRYQYAQIVTNSSAADYSVAMMIDAVTLYYIPLALSLVVLIAITRICLKNTRRQTDSPSHK